MAGRRGRVRDGPASRRGTVGDGEERRDGRGRLGKVSRLDRKDMSIRRVDLARSG